MNRLFGEHNMGLLVLGISRTYELALYSIQTSIMVSCSDI